MIYDLLDGKLLKHWIKYASLQTKYKLQCSVFPAAKSTTLNHLTQFSINYTIHSQLSKCLGRFIICSGTLYNTKNNTLQKKCGQIFYLNLNLDLKVMTISVNSKVKLLLDIFKLYNFGLSKRNSKVDYHPTQCFVILLSM